MSFALHNDPGSVVGVLHWPYVCYKENYATNAGSQSELYQMKDDKQNDIRKRNYTNNADLNHDESCSS